MDQDVKKRWINALRSGEYTKGRHALRQGSKVGVADGQQYFCCLGVLCDLAVKDKVVEWQWLPLYSTVSGAWYAVGTYKERSVPPTEVYEWAGIKGPIKLRTSVDGSCVIGPYDYSAVSLNDEWQRSFKDLANLIEEQM